MQAHYTGGPCDKHVHPLDPENIPDTLPRGCGPITGDDDPPGSYKRVGSASSLRAAGERAETTGIIYEWVPDAEPSDDTAAM